MARKIELSAEALAQIKEELDQLTPEALGMPKTSSTRQTNKVKKRLSEIALAQYILNGLLAECPLVYSEDQLWAYQDGQWLPWDQTDIEIAVEKLDGATILGSQVRLTNNAVKGIRESILRNLLNREFFANPAPGVLCANGFLELEKSFKLVKPAPEHACRWRLDSTYKPKLDYTEWTDFLHHVFAGDKDALEKILCLQEFVGAALAGRGVEYGKALVLLGDGANGKSTIADLLIKLFPKNPRVTSIPPQQWGKETYLASLKDSPLNLCNELADSVILNSEVFKAVITGEEITARLLYRNPFSFRSRCSHIFATNVLPPIKDLSTGFWRRLIVLPFNRDFSGEGKTKEDIINSLVHLLPAILTWAVEGARRLTKQGRYTIPESSTRILNNWLTDTDSVLSWVKEHNYSPPTLDPTMVASEHKARALYFEYKKEAIQLGRSPVSETKFGTRMTKIGFERVTKADGRYYRLYKGGNK